MGYETSKHVLAAAAHPFDAADVVWHPRDAKLQAKDAPFSAGGVADRILQLAAVPLAVRLLDRLHVRRVPVVADEAGHEKLAAQAVLARRSERMMQEQRVADGAVNHTVENVRQQLALSTMLTLEQHGVYGFKLTTRLPLFLSASRAKLPR